AAPIGYTSRIGTASTADTRRLSLWAAGPVSEARPERLPGLVVGEEAPRLPQLSALEETTADLWATGLTVGATAPAHLRIPNDPQLSDAKGADSSAGWAGWGK
ncbi:MAG: hypothetical protein WBF57_24375, partial [Mycobacterium sp.]